MPDPVLAKQVVQTFWNAVADRDFETCEATMADGIVRIGPRCNDEADVSRGRRAYSDFIRSVIGQIPSYRNVTHDLLVSDDGRRVHIHCTEWSAPESGSGQEIEVPLVMICTVDDAHLIEKVDIFWKTPNVPLDWTKADEIAAS